MKKTIPGAAIILALVWVCGAFAQGPAGMAQMFTPETMEYMNHKIDMASVKNAFVANAALAKLAKEKPEIEEDVKLRLGPNPRNPGAPPKLLSLDKMVSTIRAYPEAVAAIESSGLDVKDYFRTNYSLMYAWMLLQMDKRGMLDQMLKMMPNMQKSVNLDLVKANEAEIQKHMDQMGQLER